MNTLGSCLEEENRPAVFTPKTSGFPVIISIYTNVFKTLSLNFKNDVFSVSRINTIVKKKNPLYMSAPTLLFVFSCMSFSYSLTSSMPISAKKKGTTEFA